MEKLTFNELKSLCVINVDKKYVDECLQVLKNEDCIFESGIIMPRDSISNLYTLRFDIAKQSGKLSNDYLKDIESCVDQLSKSKSDLVGLTFVHNDSNSFLIFYEPDTETIIGILKSQSSLDIQSLEENATETVDRGFSSNAEKYSKGTFIRDWK